MGQYEEIDKRILEAVAKRSNPNSDPRCVEEGKRIADEERERYRYNCRPGYRVIEARLQELRKTGKIAYYTKDEKSGKGGWHLGPNEEVRGAEAGSSPERPSRLPGSAATGERDV
jgi:hypothetical protein